MRNKIGELTLYWDEEFNLYEIEYGKSRSVISVPANIMLRVNQVVLNILEESGFIEKGDKDE